MVTRGTTVDVSPRRPNFTRSESTPKLSVKAASSKIMAPFKRALRRRETPSTSSPTTPELEHRQSFFSDLTNKSSPTLIAPPSAPHSPSFPPTYTSHPRSTPRRSSIPFPPKHIVFFSSDPPLLFAPLFITPRREPRTRLNEPEFLRVLRLRDSHRNRLEDTCRFSDSSSEGESEDEDQGSEDSHVAGSDKKEVTWHAASPAVASPFLTSKTPPSLFHHFHDSHHRLGHDSAASLWSSSGSEVSDDGRLANSDWEGEESDDGSFSRGSMRSSFSSMYRNFV
ncbi:hypothetical protein P7C70_g7202, partial [Phenoliferia sp. Uapishka_3]